MRLALLHPPELSFVQQAATGPRTLHLMPIDCTPFIDIAPRGHRPRIGKEARVPLGGARVTPSTAAKVAAWMATLGTSRGITLDRLVSFGLAHGFSKATKKPALPTTAHAGNLPMPKAQRVAFPFSVKSNPNQQKRHGS